MWIKTTRTTSDGTPVPSRMYRRALSKPVEFTDSGTANVPHDDAQYLIETYDWISTAETDDAGGDDEIDYDADDADGTAESDTDDDDADDEIDYDDDVADE